MSVRNLATYLTRGPLIPFASVSPKVEKTSSSTADAKFAIRGSTSDSSITAAEKIEVKRVVRVVIQCARVLSDVGTEVEEGVEGVEVATGFRARALTGGEDSLT